MGRCQSLLVAAILFAPLNANAVLLRLDYSGVVTTIEGPGAGYGIGDSVGGVLLIDSDLATDVFALIPDVGFFPAPALVAGPAGTGTASFDFVQVIYDPVNGEYLVQDYERIVSGDTFIDNWVFLDLFPTGSLVGDGIVQTLDLTSSSIFRPSQYGRATGTIVNGFTTFTSIGWNNFNLNRASLAPTTVPEPGTLFLLSGGVLAIGLFRRRRTTN